MSKWEREVEGSQVADTVIGVQAAYYEKWEGKKVKIIIEWKD